MKYPPAKHNRGLTLIELMVVIGIIAVLLGLIVAVVPRMRAAGRKASVQQQINTLQSAIDSYYVDYRAYPGPLTDASVYAATNLPTNIAGRPTQAENLVLGLLGGLRRVGNDLAFDPERVGKGAVNFLPEAPSMPKPYMDVATAKTMLSGGAFKDSTGRTCDDSSIPEFVDGFEEPLPLLYLRARPGATGIVGPTYQYDVRAMTPYTASQIGGKPHGLKSVDTSIENNIPNGLGSGGPADALRYLRQPETTPNTNRDGQPRQKNRFILISAGPDRVYGTPDDITSFGNP